MHETKQLTLLDLVKAVQDIAGSDSEVVAVLSHLLKSVKSVRPMRIPARAA